MTKPTVGSSVDAWGGYVNADLDAIDSVVHGIDIRLERQATISDAPPASPQAGRLWYDSVGGQLYTFYNDGNSSQWVPTTNQLGGGYLPLTGGVMTGPITPAGIVGVTDNSNALAGQVGEYITANATGIAAAAIGAAYTICSVALTAGDWDVEGFISYTNMTGTNGIVNIFKPGQSTTVRRIARTGAGRAVIKPWSTSSSWFYWTPRTHVWRPVHCALIRRRSVRHRLPCRMARRRQHHRHNFDGHDPREAGPMIDFPASPTVGQTFIAGGSQWTWDGTKWAASGVVGANLVPAMNDSRIINGDMGRDQRNNGASGTATGYTVDRWGYSGSQANKGTWGQNQMELLVLPKGFLYCLEFSD